MAWQGLLALISTFVVFTNCQYTRQQMQEISMKARKLPNDVCGDSLAFGEKIINGEKVETVGAYPWMVAIGYTVGSAGPYWSCGGSLVTDQFVVTAAHCLHPKVIRKNRPLEVSWVRLGDLDLNDRVSDGAAPVDVAVEKFIYHPQYDNDQKTNDIGLIKLKQKVVFDDIKKPICLPSPDLYENLFVGSRSVVIGWGTTEKGKSTFLSEASVNIQDTDMCKNNITKVLPRSVLDHRVICASSPGKDSCQGDSGGPLMLFRRYKQKAKIFLLGVVSYGYGCATDGYPGVYTRVSSFMDWLILNLEF